MSTIQEVDTYKFAIDNGNISDVADLVGKTPFDSLLEKEERELNGTQEEMEIRQEAISALLSYLFRPSNGLAPTVNEVAIRCFTLVYTLRPALIDNMTCDEIGKLFETSRQTISKRVLNQDKDLNIHARTRKSETAVSIYREGTAKWWAERKELERKKKIAAYNRAYKARNREKIREMNRKYYERTKKNIGNWG